jgi:hypothetical protein
VREGHRLRVYENRVLRRIFGPKRDDDQKEEDEASRVCGT